MEACRLCWMHGEVIRYGALVNQRLVTNLKKMLLSLFKRTLDNDNLVWLKAHFILLVL